MKRIHLQEIKRSNQKAATRYRTNFIGKTLDEIQLNTLKQEGHNDLLDLAGGLDNPTKLNDHQKAAIIKVLDKSKYTKICHYLPTLSFNCRVLLLLYEDKLNRKDIAFIREEQQRLGNLAQKLAQHDEPTRNEKRFLTTLTSKRGRGL